MKIVYVITSENDDKHVNMLYLSVMSLKYVHPESEVIVLCDKVSERNMRTSSLPIIEVIDRFISMDTPNESAAWKNRYIRCRMRRLIVGDFLFLDSDIIISRRIDEIFSVKADFAAASNLSLDFPKSFIDKFIFDLNKWTYPDKQYLNGGVQFWRDNSSTRHLGQLYEKYWTESSAIGLHYDQPALNYALASWYGNFQMLENRFNAQIYFNLTCGVDAHIWHFYSSLDQRKIPVKSYFELGLSYTRDEGSIPDSYFKSVLQSRIPFVTSSKKNEGLLIKLLHRKGYRFKSYEYQSYSGYYFGVVNGYIQEIIRSIRK